MSLVYNETKKKTIELIDIGNGLMYIDPTTQKKNILVKLTNNSYYNIGTRKTETLVGLAKSGGGVKFKTSIYATGNAYILLNRITANGIRVKGSIKTIKKGPEGHSIVAFRTSSSSYTVASIAYQYSSYTCYLTIGSQNNISTTQLINSSGQIVLENFDITKKNMDIFNAKWGILCQNNNGSIDNYFNDVGKINLITLLYNDNEVANLVPAIVEGESGMYDTINEQFYGNANSVGSLVCE